MPMWSCRSRRRLSWLPNSGPKPNQNEDENAGNQADDVRPSQMTVVPGCPGQKDHDGQHNQHGRQDSSLREHRSSRLGAQTGSRYRSSSVASVSSGGGDPPRVSSGVVSSCATGARTVRLLPLGRRFAALRRFVAVCRFTAGRRLALVRRFPVVRRFEVAPRFPEVRRFEVVPRFAGVRFFRDEREVAARFLRFAMSPS